MFVDYRQSGKYFCPSIHAGLQCPVRREDTVSHDGFDGPRLSSGYDSSSTASAYAKQPYGVIFGVQRFYEGASPQGVGDFLIRQSLAGRVGWFVTGVPVVAVIEGKHIEPCLQQPLAVPQRAILVGSELMAKNYGRLTG